MRRRIGICGVSDEILELVPQLLANPEIEIARVFDVEAPSTRTRLDRADPRTAALIERILTSDLAELLDDTSLSAIVDASPGGDLGERLPESGERDLQVVSVLTARMLWGRGTGVACAPEPGPVLGERGFEREAAVANARHLARRAREEIARTGGRQGSLAIASARIENLREIERHAQPGGARRVVERVNDALRACSRDLDVVRRVAVDEFVLVLPDAGPQPHDRVVLVARTVARDVCCDETLNDPVPVSLAFGYASHPEHGASADALIRRAREPRIRVL